jgi:8-oxo-dGTP diphosphatase
MASWPGVDGLPAGIEVPWGYAPPAGEPVEWSVPCAGAVVRDHQGRILLVRRGQAPSRGMWSLPGGRIESGETWADAAVREVSEETGIAAQDPVFIGIVERDSESGSTYVIADYAMRGAGCPAPGDDADDARWCDARDIEALVTSPGLVEALREWGELPEG